MTREIEAHLARAEEALRAAAELLRLELLPDSLSRSYYAVFHAATAVLLSLGIERSSHRGIWAAFGQFVTNQGLMDIEYHRAALQLYRFRIRSDYVPEAPVTQQNAEEAFGVAREFLGASRRFLEERPGG